MADAILWTHIFTGPERFEDEEKRLKLYELCTRRFRGEDGLTEEIESLAESMVCGYQYPYEVYREIAMQNSDFGGMENTGNTTIIASRIMPDAEITDASYEYMLGVKQHEFYHNLNGSSVTGDTPFSICLENLRFHGLLICITSVLPEAMHHLVTGFTQWRMLESQTSPLWPTAG